jgi:uncharacterized protein
VDKPVIEVPPELFVIAESSSFAGTYSLDELAAGPDTYRFSSPVSYDVTITNTGDALLIMGSAQASATTECARCLEDFSIDIDGEIEGYFLLSEDSQRPEDMDDDEFDVLPADHKLDLAPLIEAALLVDIPLIPLCAEDCKGLCAKCGSNLNEGPCACEAGEDDADDLPRMSDGRVSPFAALKGMDFGQ